MRVFQGALCSKLQEIARRFRGQESRALDGPAFRNTNRGDYHQLVRANRFAEKPLFHNVQAILANRLKPAIR